MRYFKAFFLPVILCLVLCSQSCKTEPKVTISTINVRINESPDGLFPFTSKSGVAGQINSKIYLPLADFNPSTLVLEPVLLVKIPDPVISSAGESYDMEILEDAVWSDGKPVTSGDVLYTLKLVANPYSKFGSINSTIKNIVSITTEDPAGKTFNIVFNGKYHLDLEAFTNLPVMPRHLMDPDSLLEKYTYELISTKGDSLKTQTDSAALSAAPQAAINSTENYKNIIGSGPYVVSDWMPGQRITLKKTGNYWGEKQAKKRSQLQAYPTTINYLILPEEATAMAALKAGQIDILADVPETSEDVIKGDPNLAARYDIASPDVLQYYYIGLNNNGPLLRDINLRKALNQLLNVDELIQSLMGGLATRVVTPVLPQKPYYLKNINPPKYDPKAAAAILDQTGYKTKGKDGIRLITKDGKTQRLSFTLLTTGKQLGKDIGALLSEEARRVGIEIKIEVLDFSKILERVKAGNYDMANLVVRQFPGLDDPYLAWNSANAFGKGGNYCNFSHPAIDRITEEIRIEKSAKQREKLYKNFQKTLASQYPVIFLFSPKNRIIVRKELHPEFSVKRPGYFENTMH